jgi:hypothetical protein
MQFPSKAVQVCFRPTLLRAIWELSELVVALFVRICKNQNVESTQNGTLLVIETGKNRHSNSIVP